MSRFIDLKLIGDKRLQKKFSKMQHRVQSKIMKDAAKKAMEPVHVLAKQLAPVGKTGRTKRNIKIGVARKRFWVGAEVRTGTRRQMGIPSEAAFYYPAAFEYGTKHMAARPFLRNALAQRRRIAINILGREIKKMMRRL